MCEIVTSKWQSEYIERTDLDSVASVKSPLETCGNTF